MVWFSDGPPHHGIEDIESERVERAAVDEGARLLEDVGPVEVFFFGGLEHSQ
jgi:hypothetical protein